MCLDMARRCFAQLRYAMKYFSLIMIDLSRFQKLLLLCARAVQTTEHTARRSFVQQV